MTMIKRIIAPSLLITSLHANISNMQMYRLKEVIRTAKLVERSTNIHYVNTICSIFAQESSFGKNIVGDTLENKYYIIHRGRRIFVNKHNLYYREGKPKYKYLGYTKRVYVIIDSKKPISKSSLGPFQMKIDTAKLIINKYPKLRDWYGWLLYNDKALINTLLTNIKVSTILAYYYLIYCREIAIHRNYPNVWRSTVSRYNGGWHNHKYILAISKKLKLIRKLRRKNNL